LSVSLCVFVRFSHAIAQAMKLAQDLPKDICIVLCNLSGRGFDRNVHTIWAGRGLRFWAELGRGAPLRRQWEFNLPHGSQPWPTNGL
jgi:hypothetical protein